jgi:enterochelin esterase family protein
MKLAVVLALALAMLTTAAANQPDTGRLEGPFEFHSDIFPNTVRQYWIFVPAQYDPAVAASVLVFQDGQRAVNPAGPLRVPEVMAELIANGEMPVTIGLFVTPDNGSTHYPADLGMSNPDRRAEEYDAIDDRYARFLLEELLPEVGRKYTLSDNPEQRAIGGSSSGAICAFTVAWHRPEAFGKVISFIGSYVSIGFRPEENPVRLGGQDYPALIRREPIRNIRIFMQDGSNDLDNEWGNWFLANQQMAAAFRYANRVADENGQGGPRYTLKTVWTDGGHSDGDGGALLPDALRWLWSTEH